MAPPVLYRVIYGTSSPQPIDFPAMQYLTIKPALLHNYRRHRVHGCDYPAIRPEEGGVVRGNLVMGLTGGDVNRLDIFEGEAYVRGDVDCVVLEGVSLNEAAPAQLHGKEAGKAEQTTVKAQTYIWDEGAEGWLDPEEWDFEEFKKHKMSRWAGLDASDGGWGNQEEDQDQEVQVDEGFADVDRAVAAMANGEQDGSVDRASVARDPMGGRGVNGAIGRQLATAQQHEI